jgi:WD40 repeat protein
LTDKLLEGEFISSDLSPDGKYIVTPLAETKTARLWNAETKQPVGKLLVGHTDLAQLSLLAASGSDFGGVKA